MSVVVLDAASVSDHLAEALVYGMVLAAIAGLFTRSTVQLLLSALYEFRARRRWAARRRRVSRVLPPCDLGSATGFHARYLDALGSEAGCHE